MMRRLTSVMTLVLICGVASAAPAQDATADKAAPNARLRAEIHRTMAALIEAQAAETPDQEQIQRLTDQLRDLRQELGAPGAAARGGRTGRPGRGLGMGPGAGRGQGPGLGAGMGPWRGYGRGPGMGPGGGRGRGQGPGPGPGWGRGGGPGRGYGPGFGRGYGAGRGYGPGYGRGWGFIDEDRDGVCDHFEWLWDKP